MNSGDNHCWHILTYGSKPFDWKLLLSDFVRILKSVPALDSVLPVDGDIFLFFHSRLPNKSFQAIDLFLMIGTLIPHFSPAYYDQLFVELFGEGNFPELWCAR